VTRALRLGGAGTLVLAGVLWAMPSNAFFDGLLPDFLKHISLRLIVFVGTSALTRSITAAIGRRSRFWRPRRS